MLAFSEKGGKRYKEDDEKFAWVRSSSTGTRAAAVVGSTWRACVRPSLARRTSRREGREARAIASDADRTSVRCPRRGRTLPFLVAYARMEEEREGGSRRSRCDTMQPESREDRPSRVHPRLPHISSLPVSLAKVLPSSKLAPVASCDGLVLLAG